MNWMLKACAFLAATAIVAGLAVAVKLNHLETGVVSTGKTEVTLNITVRGTGGRAVRNAVLSIYDQEQIFLGNSNDKGLLNVRTRLSSGRSLILQAEGIAFKMQRTILIPRAVSYSASVFFDLAEVHEGNAHLISTENAETTALVKVPTPSPQILAFEGYKLKLSEVSREALTGLLNDAALKIGLRKNSTLSCRSWEGDSMFHECEFSSGQNDSVFRVFQSLPSSLQSAELFLNTFLEKTELLKDKKTEVNERIFIIKHNNSKFRLYFDVFRLNPTNEKKDIHYFKFNVSNASQKRVKSELILITDKGQILQKNIFWPSRKKTFFLRIPASNKIDLSRREPEISIPR